MRIKCKWDELVARLLCAKVEEFTAHLPVANRAVEFISWKEARCKWTESPIAGVIPSVLQRLFATVQTATSRGRAKAKLFLEDIIVVGEDGYPGEIVHSKQSCSCCRGFREERRTLSSAVTRDFARLLAGSGR